MHQRLLVRSSAFFRDWREESEEGEIYLPFHNSNDMSKTVEWLYKRKVEVFKAAKGKSQFLLRIAVLRSIEFYSLAAKLGIPDLMEFIMDQLMNFYLANGLRPSAEEIKLAYNKTGTENGLRSFMARSYRFTLLGHPDLPTHMSDYKDGKPSTEELLQLATSDPELASDAFKLIRNVIPQSKARNSKTQTVELQDPFDAEFCEYHQHNSVEGCFRRGLRISSNPLALMR